MRTIRLEDKQLLEAPQNYQGYQVILNVIKEEDISQSIDIFQDHNPLYKVDIIIKKDGKEYCLKDYYIRLQEGLTYIGNSVARRLIESINDITLQEGKFIGQIIQTGNAIEIVKDREISEQLNEKRYRENKRDARLRKIYFDYQIQKGKQDKDVELKYAGFLDFQFSSARIIPDFVRETYARLKRIKEPIFDYSSLDSAILEEFDGKWAALDAKIKAANKEAEELQKKIDENSLSQEKETTDDDKSYLGALTRLLIDINKYLESKKEKDKNPKPKEETLLSKIRKYIPILGKEKSKSETNDIVVGDKSEEYTLRTRTEHILRAYNVEEESIIEIKKYPIERIKEEIERSIAALNKTLETGNGIIGDQLSEDKINLLKLHSYIDNICFTNLTDYLNSNLDYVAKIENVK